MRHVAELVAGRADEVEVEGALGDLCNEFPDHFAEACRERIIGALGLVVQLARQGAQPPVICQRLGLCGDDASAIRRLSGACAQDGETEARAVS